MNNTKPPFDNEEVRQAFALAIDKQRIVDNFFPAGSTIAEQFVYPDLKPGYTDGLKWYNFDKAKAKQMLTDAGFDFNQTILFSYRNASRGYAPAARQNRPGRPGPVGRNRRQDQTGCPGIRHPAGQFHRGQIELLPARLG